jgi:hypothetical protein
MTHKCKLCGYGGDSVCTNQTFQQYHVHCSNKNCFLNSIYFSEKQWETLMSTELESTLANREEHIARVEKENAVLNRAVDIVISEVERYRLAYESGGYSVMSDIEWRESYRGNVLAQSKGLCNAD